MTNSSKAVMPSNAREVEMDPNVVWGGLFAVGAAYEVYALFNKKVGDTLSERTRALFRVGTRPGRVIFTAAWCAFSVWFLRHILTEAV